MTQMLLVTRSIYTAVSPRNVGKKYSAILHKTKYDATRKKIVLPESKHIIQEFLDFKDSSLVFDGMLVIRIGW